MSDDDLCGLAARESAAVVSSAPSEPDYVTRLRAYIEGRGVLRGEDIVAMLRDVDRGKVRAG